MILCISSPAVNRQELWCAILSTAQVSAEDTEHNDIQGVERKGPWGPGQGGPREIPLPSPSQPQVHDVIELQLPYDITVPLTAPGC